MHEIAEEEPQMEEIVLAVHQIQEQEEKAL
jgi:hypothetical protein